MSPGVQWIRLVIYNTIVLICSLSLLLIDHFVVVVVIYMYSLILYSLVNLSLLLVGHFVVVVYILFYIFPHSIFFLF